MADGIPMDHSYSPSGSTIEVIDLASTHPSTRLSLRVSSTGINVLWLPKLTLYRLLVIFSTAGLAAAKTATSLFNLTFVSITLEWILGVVVFLCFYLLGVYEKANNRYLTWLFDFDYMEYFWISLESLSNFKRPYYISDEIDARHQTMGIDPLVTGYRIIVTVLVASFGMTKSALLYGQEPVGATTVECVFGVGMVTGLYWLGLYEASSIKVYPTLFHVDYSAGLLMETATVFLHLFSLLIFSAVSSVYYPYAAMIFSPEVAVNFDGTVLDELFPMLIVGVASSAMFVGGAVGGLALMCHLGWRYRASPLGRFIARLRGVRFLSYVHRKYWLPSGHSLRPRPRLFYLKRFIVRQSVRLPLSCILLCGMIVILMFCVCVSLALHSFFLYLLKESPWYWLLLFVSISLPLVAGTVVFITVMLHSTYQGVVYYFLEARKDFTVDIEPGGVPVDAPFESV